MENKKDKLFYLFLSVMITGLVLAFLGWQYHRRPINAHGETEEFDRIGQPYICPTDDTKITYSDGYYYYQSAADFYYLYRSDESGENRECLVKQVPKEIYVMEDWVYFTNLSQGSKLFRIRTDGSGMELVCGEKIKRFLPMEGKFYCLTKTEDGDRIFSCTGEGETENIFEGECDWLCTDGKLLYFDMEDTSLAGNTQEEAEFRTVAMDGEGNIKEEYETVLWNLIPTKKYLYYCESIEADGEWVYEIVKLDRRTGKAERYGLPDVHFPVEWRTFHYAVYQEEIYLFLYSPKHRGDVPNYRIFKYREEKQRFTGLCQWEKISGASTFYDKAEGIYPLNDKIFYKSYRGEGFGQLWHMADISGGSPVLFEGMKKPVEVDSLGGYWLYSATEDAVTGNIFHTGYREGYLEPDIEYKGETEDNLGNVIETVITLPKISDVIPAASVINGKIREDAKGFFEEQSAFHEMVREQESAQGEWENRSWGSLGCHLAYADERYVSIVYRKDFSTPTAEYQKEYVTRLYSSETGEELQPEDLFTADWEEEALRLSFFIRRTQTAFSLFWDDLFFPECTFCRIFYCLTEEGLDVFFVEDMRTFKEWHFVIPYEYLEGDVFGGGGVQSSSAESNICQTDDTKITYSDGYYYYQSAADFYYLYRSDESGENRECLVKQVPKEIYVMGDWVYFTNLSQGSKLFRIRTDGSGMELVCSEKIKRFLPMGEKFYCLTETEDGGRIFSCTEDGETENLFEGKCSWLCTDGKLLYFETDNPEWEDSAEMAENTQEEAEFRTVAIDGEGNIKEEYETVLRNLIPTEKYLYYRETRLVESEYVYEIVRLDRRTGRLKRYELPDSAILLRGDFSYAVCRGEIYVFMYDRYAPAYYICKYRKAAERFEKICSPGKMEGGHTFYGKAEGIHLVNGKIFCKSYEGEGFGQLWHMADISGGKPVLFEGMEEPVAVTTIGEDRWWNNGSREGYVEQDIEYSEEKKDGQGYIMETDLTLPRIGREVPAATVINGKIRRDAEQFYEEQLAFHETEEVREEMANLGGDDPRSRGSFYCYLAYADERYVSIVYRKTLSVYSSIYERAYVTKLYSSKTGEELQPQDLFTVDWEEASLRLSFLIRRTETGIEYCDGDLFSLDAKRDKVFYCLTENGLEVFWEETSRRYVEPHLIIPYEYLEGDLHHDQEDNVAIIRNLCDCQALNRQGISIKE